MVFPWGFRSNVKIHQSKSDKSIDLPLRNGEKTIKYADFIKNELPVIDEKEKLWLNPLLFNGLLQTLYYSSANLSHKFQVYYGREIFTYEDGGVCSIDHVIPQPENKEEFKALHDKTLPEGWPKLHPRSRYFSNEELEQINSPSEGSQSTKPICVVLHGLAGGSHEPLIRNLAEYLSTGKNENKWDTLVINSRGCCRTKITNGKLFTALSTGDIHEVLVELKKRNPNRPIYTVGFSFGAAILANYLAETKDDTMITAACLVGCPWDLVDSAYHIDKSWSGSYLFNPALTSFLNKLVKNNFTELNHHNPELFNEENLKRGMKQTKTWQFDSVYTCHTIGYSNPFEYYRDASPVNRILKIHTPTLILNSTDDPAVGVRLPWMEVETNPHLCMVETDLGGHLGYVQSSGKFWCVQLVEEFFAKFDELIAS